MYIHEVARVSEALNHDQKAPRGTRCPQWLKDFLAASKAELPTGGFMR
jgi:hypothetical protein